MEMVGGKTELEYDGCYDGPYMISKMATALAKAGRNKKIFRKTSHYMRCLTRWAGVAVGVGQWSWTCHEGHMETITHLIERESIRCGQIGTWIAKLYCKFRRSSWAQRCRQRDPSLMDIAELERETLLIDETVPQTARTRIAMVMRQCGVNGSPSMPDNAKAYENVNSAMAKLMTAMDAMVKKCNEAARAMAKEQSQMGNRSNCHCPRTCADTT